jgi:probable O-glycosylation ligase (exosortase A-associated)
VRDFIVVGAVVIGMIMTLRRPWFGVLLWTWVSIMNPHRFCWGFAVEAPVAAMAAGATLFGLLIARERQNPFMSAPVKWLLVFTGWMTLSWLLGYGIRSSDADIWLRDYDMWKRVMKTFLMIFVTMALLRNRHQIVAFIWVVVMSLGIIGAKGGLFTLATLGAYRVWGPPGSFIEDNNEFALALVTIIPLLYFLLLQVKLEQRMLRLGLWSIMVLCAIAAIGSQSRGGFLALSAMVVVLWWRSPYKAKLALFIGVTVAAILLLMPDEYWERMNTIMAYEEDLSAMNRIRSWWVAVEVALHRVTGAGMLYQHPIVFYLWDYSTAQDQGKAIAAHSIYFQILGNHGFAGLSFYLMIGVTTYQSAGWLRRHARDIAEAKWAAMLGSMVQVAMAGFAVGGAFLSLAYVDIPFNMMVMVVLARHWVETRGWERDPQMGFFEYCFKSREPHRPPVAAAPAG